MVKGLVASVVVFLVVGVGSRSFADVPRIVVPDRGHRYVVWLEPNVGTEKPPLTDADRARYCAAAEGMARRIWATTNGRHRIFQVEFNYGDAPIGGYDIDWKRSPGTAHVSRLGQLPVFMYDARTDASHRWTEGPTPEADVETCRFPTAPDQAVCIQAICPDGFTVTSTGETNRETCQDANQHSPLETAAMAGYTLAHEASHSHYVIPDEYYDVEFDPAPECMANPDQPQCKVLYGIRICSNVDDWHTSMMATSTDFWCDINTHLLERHVKSPFEGNVIIQDPHGQTLDSWTQAKASWADLASYDPGNPVAHVAGSQPTNEYFVKAAAPWQPHPLEPEFCKFTGSDIATAVINDLIIVVDKSGSMGYQYTAQDLTAFEAAFAAALGQFNRTPTNRKAGVTVFDSVVTPSIPYAPRTVVRQISDFTLTAGGSTNLCAAISNAAQQVRAGGTDDAQGHMLLLTDGKPTVTGCNTAEAVRTAASEACNPSDPNLKPVVISALAFGDADYALIQQISDLCGGEARSIDGSGQGAPTPPQGVPPGSPAPINIKVAATRLAYKKRGFTEGLFIQEPKPLVFERSFDVPPSSNQVEFIWMAERTSFSDPDIIGVRCEFANDYGFEILDPAGNPTGFDVVNPAVEMDYMTRTRRVLNPTPGRWTMRTTGGSPCVVGGSRAAPQVAMMAVYRNNTVRSHLTVEKAVVSANERARVTAFLEVGTNTAVTNISVTGRLVNGATQVSVPMFDDGVSGGDDRAGDGLYSGFVNPSCGSGYLPPGGYRLVVELRSDANTAQPVIMPDPDVREKMGLGAIPPESRCRRRWSRSG